MNFDERMNGYLARIEKALQEALPQTDCPQAEVFDAARYSVGAGGKRVRPVLLLAFCEALGGDLDKAAPFAAAVELLHTYTLIHDDLPCMDNDDMRRGRPSCHIQFGEATALLAGDGLLNRAFEVMLAACTDMNGVAAAKALADSTGMFGTVGGQVIDLQTSDRPTSEEVILDMYRKKTGELLAAPCRMGVCLAGGTVEQQLLAYEFGIKLGLSFQIIDDLLDIYGDQQTLGKPTGSDWDNHKLTYASLHSKEGANRTARMYSDEAVELLRQCCPEDEFLPELANRLLCRVK